jgi:hypothetical protein
MKKGKILFLKKKIILNKEATKQKKTITGWH